MSASSDTPPRWSRRPLIRVVAALAALAYLPAVTAAPGRMPSDSKLYLYLDPGRFFGDAASTFDGRQFGGWVPHQHVAYLWPSTPWFWLFDSLAVPDWVAHRLWIGTIMLAAGFGVWWLCRLLGLGTIAALVAAIVYQTSPYVLPYVSRTSVLLLPWAGLGWIVGFTIRAGRRGGWGDPAAVALVVVTVGAVNATALAMIVPGPVLWLAHAAWQRSIRWSDAALVALRIGALSTVVSLWWMTMLVIQGRFGTDVLPYSESLADVSLTATSPETWRSLGYWLFYVRDPASAATTESLRYLSSTPSIVLSYTIPILALAALAFVSWQHRRFAALLIGTGLILAVGVHPVDDRSPLMRLVAGGDESGLALALRSSTRALPLSVLGFALALAMAVDAARHVDRRLWSFATDHWIAGVVSLLAILNLPALWTGGFVDPALERDAQPPRAWLDGASTLDRSGDRGRVLQLPGAEFGAFRWGYTVDQPLPGLTAKPLVTRDLLPLGSPAAMDLLYALDDRAQDGVLEGASLGPTAQLLGVDTVWLANDLSFDRFRTARPEVVRDVVISAPGAAAVESFGGPILNRPAVPVTDERALGDQRVGAPVPVVELVELDQPGSIVRSRSSEIFVAGSGDGLVDAAAGGLIDPKVAAVRYTADLPEPGRDMDGALGLVVTDGNRDRARHWRSSQDTTGFTEVGGPDAGVLRDVASDARLDVFDATDPATQTTAEQIGPVAATATGYGEPFAYLPEHRPFMAIDGDPETAWLVGEHGDPIGETLRLEFATPVDRIVLHQPTDPNLRKITGITYRSGSNGTEITGRASLDATSWDATGQELMLGRGVDRLDLTIDEVAGGTPFTGSAVAGVGFSEIEHGLGVVREVVVPPRRAVDEVDSATPLAFVLSRLRTDPMDRWRDDPEPHLERRIALAQRRSFTIEPTVRIDARASDRSLGELFGWPVTASSRLTGSPRHAGVSAFDGDPSTMWITGFGEASGASVAMDVTVPLSTLAVRQPVTGFSTVTELTVRVGAAERRVSLTPDAAGRSEIAVEPPLAPGRLEIEVTGIESVSTIDRRFGDPVQLPAAIAEIEFDGRPAMLPVAEQRITTACVEIGAIGGEPLLARLDVGGDDWLDGGAIGAEPCVPVVELGAGTHDVVGRSSLPVHLDRIVLDDGVRAALDEAKNAATQPSAAVTSTTRFGRTIEVADCPDGCWLILGEGFNDAWSAEVDGRDLGSPTLVDGGFNGWWLDGGDTSTVVDVRWTAQRPLNIALVLSLLAVLGCVALVVRTRIRAADSTVDPVRDVPPRLVTGSFAPIGRPVVLLVVWTVGAALLIGPSWSLWGALGGLTAFRVRRVRLPELTALATLIVVAVAVIVRERRSAPAPNGGWPSVFESFHQLGLFAVVSVIVAAAVAGDADEA